KGGNVVKFKKKVGFTPSETNLCIRYWYYLFNGLDMIDNTEARAQRIFDTGHSTHERRASYFKAAGILATVEKEMPPSVIDGVAFGKMFLEANVFFADRNYIVEMKSISTDGFHAVARRGTH